MSGLTKLKIESFTDPKLQKKPVETFEVMFNPNSYSVKYAVEYDTKQGKGSTSLPQKFLKSKPSDFSIEFVLDGTGASGGKGEVSSQVGAFLKTVHRFDGKIHRPRYLRLAWGTLVVSCVFKGADIKYNLFEQDGNPLRATVTATFLGYVEEAKGAALQGKQSPDLFHVHEVQEGESLPALAQQFYEDPAHYLELARYNRLNNFRQLEEGTRLVFPPLAKR